MRLASFDLEIASELINPTSAENLGISCAALALSEGLVEDNPVLFSDKFLEPIKKFPLFGKEDAVVLARFPSRRKMDNFLKKIQTYEFVERTETKLILRTMKEDSIGAVDL